MAITRAQQAKQMLQNGGMLVKPSTDGKRPGYRGDAAYRSFSAQSTGAQRGTATKSELGDDKPGRDEPSLRDDPTVPQNVKDSKDDEIFKKRRELKKEVQKQEEEKAEEKVERFRNKQFKGFPFGVTSLLNPLFQKGMIANRNFFLDKVLGAGRLGDLTPEEFANLSLSEQEAAYKDYMSNRLEGKTDAYGNPTRGFSYDSEGNLVGNFIDDGGPDPILPILPTTPTTPTPEDPRQILSTRILGSQFDPTFFAADGGIADLARQELFVGGLVKGIKKGLKGITRGIKKVAKSPIGKLALAAAAGGYGFGLGPFKGMAGSGFLKGSAVKNFLFKDGVPGLSNLSGKGIASIIGGASLLPLLMGAKEEDEFDIDAYYAANRLNPNAPLNRRILGSEFSFAEGGSTEKEPVATKTLPLLDMGGQEMDLRAEGGFVPIGRMEKADDVPARLSKNEFVFTAEAVRNAGDGDVDKGAEVMYNMMKNLEDGGDVSEESQGLEGARKMFQTSQRLGEVL